MTAFLRKIISVLLLPVHLAAFTGMAVNTHLCLASGKQDVSLLPLEKCCAGDAQEDCSLDKGCCRLSSTYLHLPVTLLQEKSGISQSIIAEAAWLGPLPSLFIEEPAVQPVTCTAAPPPPSGRARLAWVCTLIS